MQYKAICRLRLYSFVVRGNRSYLQNDLKDLCSCTFAEEVECVFRSRRCGRDQLRPTLKDIFKASAIKFTYKEERKIEVGERCPSKQELYCVIYKLEL